jgi:hypothetical protein
MYNPNPIKFNIKNETKSDDDTTDSQTTILKTIPFKREPGEYNVEQQQPIILCESGYFSIYKKNL